MMTSTVWFWRMLTIDFFFTNSYPFEAHDMAVATSSFVETEFAPTASAFGGLKPCYFNIICTILYASTC